MKRINYTYIMYMINKIRNYKGYVRGLPHSPNVLGRHGYMNYNQLRQLYLQVQKNQKKMGFY